MKQRSQWLCWGYPTPNPTYNNYKSQGGFGLVVHHINSAGCISNLPGNVIPRLNSKSPLKEDWEIPPIH